MSSSTSTLAYDIIARDRASSTFTKIGRAAGALGIGLGAAGLVQFVKDSVNVEAAFSQTMASLQVNSGVGDRALRGLSDLAIKFGQDTVFSASEAASAMLELSKGGMSAAQIKGGALASTLNLAQTEGIDLAQAATIMTQTLHEFGLNARQSGKAVDLLAAGAVASTASVEDLAAGLKYVGSTAHSMRYPMGDVVTALAALNNAGLDSTTAGTSLNRMLLGLTLGTDKASRTAKSLGLSFTDAKGNMLPLVDVVKRLDKAFGDMSTAERNNSLKKIFGVEGMRAANILLDQGAGKWRHLKKAVEEEGVAQKMADARMSGTKGALERLRGTIETVELKLGKALAPAVEDVADALTDNLGPAMDTAIDLGGDVVGALEPFAEVLKVAGKGAVEAAKFLDELPDPIKTIGIEAGLAALVLPKLSSAVGTVSSAMKNGYTYARVYGLELSDVETRGAAVSTGLAKLGGVAKQVAGIGGMLALADGAQQSNRWLGLLEQTAGGAALGFSMGGPWGALVGGVGGGLIAALGGLGDEAKSSGEAFRKARPPAAEYASTLDDVTGATTRATRALAYDQLLKTGAIKQGKELGLSSRTLVNYLMGQEAAQKHVNRVLERGGKAAATYIDANGNLVEVYNTHTKASRDLAATLGIEQKQLNKDAKATRDKHDAIASLREIMKSLPKSVKTDIRENAPEAQQEIKDLAKQYDLTPKQVQTVLKQLGVDKSIADLRRLLDVQKQYKDKTVTITTRFQYEGRQYAGGPTRGQRDDTAPSQKASTTGRTSGRYTAGRSDVERMLAAGGKVEIQVTGLSDGQRAFMRMGHTGRYW